MTAAAALVGVVIGIVTLTGVGFKIAFMVTSVAANWATSLHGLLAEGLTNRQISDRRNRSVETINSQVKSLLAKADCANRTQLIRRATTIGCRFLA